MMSLCLTFGGAPGQYEWSVISKAICNLTMALMHDDDWDPTTLQASAQKLVPKRKKKKVSIQLHTAFFGLYTAHVPKILFSASYTIIFGFKFF